MPITIRRLCLGAAMLLAAGSARADVLNFTYAFSTGDVLAGSLFGALEADGNIFDVTGQASVTFNGADVSFVPDYLQSFSDFNAGAEPSVANTGRLALDGSFADFVSYSNASGGFDMIVGTDYAMANGANIGVFGFSDLGDQPFTAASFSASVQATQVPEPATPVLLSLALLGLWAARRVIPAPPAPGPAELG